MSYRKFRPLALAVATVATMFAFSAAPANAGLLVETAQECDSPSTSQVFSPWLDYANYFHAPDGGFENGAAGWTLNGNAAVVAGNNAFDLSGPGASSLRIPAGSSAVSPAVCVGVGEPAMRFVVKKTSGGLLATMRVDVMVEDSLGMISTLPVGLVAPLTSGWQPSPQVLVVANLLPLIPVQQTPVAFRFVPQGGTWQIDDVYVDPTRKP